MIAWVSVAVCVSPAPELRPSEFELSVFKLSVS